MTTFRDDIRALMPTLYSPIEWGMIDYLIEDWKIANYAKLDDLFDFYGDNSRLRILLSLDEIYMILERLEHDKFALREALVTIMPYYIIRDLAIVWGLAYAD